MSEDPNQGISGTPTNEIPGPSVPPIVVTTPKSNVATYIGMAAVVAGVASLWVFTTPKKVLPPVAQAPATPEEVDAAVIMDRNTICDQECKKLKYTLGRWGIKACHCLNEY